MVKICILYIIFFNLLRCELCALEALNDHLSRDFKTAALNVNALVEKRDHEKLVQVVESSPLHQLRIKALKALHCNNPQIAVRFLRMLKRMEEGPIEGGADQMYEDIEIKDALMEVIASNAKISVPNKLSPGEFINVAERTLEGLRVSENSKESAAKETSLMYDLGSKNVPSSTRSKSATLSQSAEKSRPNFLLWLFGLAGVALLAWLLRAREA